MINSASGGPGADIASGGFVLASWRMNLDGGRGLDGEPHLMGTARPDVARLSLADAAALGVNSGDAVTVRGPLSSITLPLVVTGMVNGVVWLPAHIDGVATTGRLGATVSDVVQVVPAAGPPPGDGLGGPADGGFDQGGFDQGTAGASGGER